ncbi:hypothetical protein HOD05_05405 [Candidatus Woesearchaeota archaeon]|jgi:hypothetical protein|nr:hypothetical protein [Candidatus Woesearchaeota archaeon]MBT4150513.1 hypothetical protein [Candidatus Woesearchaeota archaeon]MBT4247153.1 hypothetical protein [Candidatus Woesearchaeota archaeon]MBT4434621.1 hypothetical protein [Candidatus Woesearchaeota archaeon]MBT7332527.1 hypothetical protein [Candidatus Woesearchaeota archaeon]
MLNSKGKLAVQLLTFLVVAVLSSAIMLTLVQTGVLSVRAENQPSLLDSEFVPVGRVGTLAITSFDFCRSIGDTLNCVGETDDFNVNQEIHFKFVVETTTSYGQIQLVENYRVKDSEGNIILNADTEDDFYFDLETDQKQELVTMAEYFLISNSGDYTLELIVKNPHLGKTTTITEGFSVE